jgi:hypothetical protein
VEVGPFASIENQLKLLTKYQKQTFQALRDVGINNLPVPKTDTQETENLDKEISLDQEGASLCSFPLSKHASTKWLTEAPPYIPDAVVLAPHLGFVLNLSRVAKRLGGWVRAYSLVGNGVIQESRRRSKDLLNMQVT